MADNTTQTGSATIAADDVGGVLHQRMKVEYGADGSATDVSPTTPLPTINPDGTATGTISATDAVLGTHAGAGVPLTGTPTANSYVAYAVRGGESGFTLRLSGTFGGGTVWMESSVDSTNGVDGAWTTNIVRQSGIDTTTLDTSITSAGMFRGVAAGYAYLRCRVTGATTPSITVAFRASAGPSVTAQVASLPPGANAIGTVDVRGTALSSTSGNVAAAGTGTIGPLDVSRAGNVTFIAKNQTAGTAWAGAPVLVFEQSDDNTSWAPLIVARNDTGVAAATHILGVNTANAEIMFDAPAESMTWVRCRVTTGPTTNPMTVVINSGGLAFSPVVTAITNPITPLPMGTATGTTAASINQVGRVIRATANVAQTTAATLIAAPAAGTRIYVTNITCTNEGATLTVVRLFAGSLPSAAGAVAYINDCFDFAIAASGGGAGLNFPPNAPWGLPLATALSYAVTVATTWDITIGYFVAA